MLGDASTFQVTLRHEECTETQCSLAWYAQVGKEGGLRKEMTAFHERWVAGRGYPTITAAYDSSAPIKCACQPCMCQNK